MPGVVFEEAVRQYPKWLRKALSDIGRAIGKEKTNLQALGLSVPQSPPADADALIAAYPTDLRRTLSQPGCEIADPPSEAELAGSWTVH